MRTAPIRDACRQEFVSGMLYSKQEVKAKLQKIYDNLDFQVKQPKQQNWHNTFLFVKQKLNDEGKRVFFIEILE